MLYGTMISVFGATLSSARQRRLLRGSVGVAAVLVLLDLLPLALGSWPSGPRQDLCLRRAEKRFGPVEKLPYALDVRPARWRLFPPGWECDFKRSATQVSGRA